MALRVLDGNQTATTLSSVVTGGEHIVAHSVVCLGSTAIANITNAVSGSVVSISNFPSTQTVAGTVTATNNAIDNYLISAFEDAATSDASVAIRVQGTPGYPMPISGTVTANVLGYDPYNGTYPQLPVGLAVDGFGSNDNVVKALIGTESGGVSTNNPLPISGTVTASLNENTIIEGGTERILGTNGGFTLSGGVGLAFNNGSAAGVVGTNNPLPISGTVTANLPNSSLNPLGVSIWNDNNQLMGGDVPMGVGGVVTIAGVTEFRFLQVSTQGSASVFGTVTVGNSVTIGSLPAISGTVTANVAYSTSITGYAGGAGSVTALPVVISDKGVYGGSSLGYNGTNTYLNVGLEAVGGNTLRSGGTLPISGTVTVAAPNGSLTTRFGTPTTANVSFATAAVTKSDRKYLLIQNVTTGSNVITVGIGFTPTTTQGIQLTAGAGITFESSYIPTGAVYVLSSVTASNFTILEA